MDGKAAELDTNPLESYLATHPTQRPKSDVVSSSMWRGYIAHWQVTDGVLRLFKVEIKVSGAPGIFAMKDVTAQYFPAAPVVAEWYTGALIIPRGELVNYVHMGYASAYEAYTIVAINGGRVVRRDDLSLKDFEQYKRAKFSIFKQSKTYAAEFEKTKRELKDATMTEEFLYELEAERYLSMAAQ